MALARQVVRAIRRFAALLEEEMDADEAQRVASTFGVLTSPAAPITWHGAAQLLAQHDLALGRVMGADGVPSDVVTLDAWTTARMGRCGWWVRVEAGGRAGEVCVRTLGELEVLLRQAGLIEAPQ